MVMLEAMAVGCPVIAFRRGAAAELITSDDVGFLVENVKEMAERLPLLDAIDRHAVRAYVETSFSSSKMTKSYLRVYRKVARRRQSAAIAILPRPGFPKYDKPGVPLSLVVEDKSS